MPLDRAKRLIFTGDVIDGEQAVAWGLCTELSERPVEDALALAGRIAERSPDAVRRAKWLLNQSHRVGVREGLANEFACSQALMGGANQIEAVVAKLQKRPPRFRDPDATREP